MHWALGRGYQGAKPTLACAVGDVATAQATLAADPAWANAGRADHGMPPLACATFSGLIALPAFAPGIRTYVELLLGAGADANVRWPDPELPHDPLSILYGDAGRNHPAAFGQTVE